MRKKYTVVRFEHIDCEVKKAITRALGRQIPSNY